MPGPALQGRGSATRDEAIAAAYVAAQFERFGLKTRAGHGRLYAGRAHRSAASYRSADAYLAGRPALPRSSCFSARRTPAAITPLLRSADPDQMPASDIVVVDRSALPLRAVMGAARSKHVKLLILPATPARSSCTGTLGNKPAAARSYLEGSSRRASPVLATLSAADIAVLAAKTDGALTLSAPIAQETAETTNAIGYLPGTDPKAGNLLISAHLDHLGIVNGTIMPGANDDASGTTAVIELAHALGARASR